MYVVARVRAQRFFDGAMRHYEEDVRQKLADADSPHRWWRTLREPVFGVKQSVPPLVDPATGFLVSEPDRKAELLMRTFEAKQNSRILELPPTCHPMAVLRGVAFRSRKIRELLSDFYSYGGTDSLGFFPLFNKEIAFPFSPKFAEVISHLIQEGVFPGYQFAYRSGRGTCNLLLTLDHVLQSTLDRAAEVRVVQLDFSAEFDRVNHSGLIYMLKILGVFGPVLSVLEQFLSSRRHRVCVNGGVSGWSHVVSGVLQGSVLEPILFVLYTSDLSHVVDSQVCCCCSDDTTVVAPVQRSSLRATVGMS